VRDVVVVVASGVAGMRHIAVAIVDGVASATTLGDLISFALPFPLSWSLSSFTLPVLVALSVAEVSIVLTFGRHIVADIRARPHPLMTMNLV
jgi:hypothetical protein